MQPPKIFLDVQKVNSPTFRRTKSLFRKIFISRTDAIFYFQEEISADFQTSAISEKIFSLKIFKIFFGIFAFDAIKNFS